MKTTDTIRIADMDQLRTARVELADLAARLNREKNYGVASCVTTAVVALTVAIEEAQQQAEHAAGIPAKYRIAA